MSASSCLRVVTVFVCLFLWSAPASAGAKWWLSWLDELSGPGPFKGQTFAAELWCFTARNRLEQDALEARIKAATTANAAATHLLDRPADQTVDSLRTILKEADSALTEANKQLEFEKRLGRCYASRENALVSVVFEAGQWNDNPKGRYDGDTNLNLYQAIFYFPLHRVLGPPVQPDRTTRAIELGAGVGAYRLTGSTIREPEWWRGSIPLRVRFIPSELFYKDRSQRSHESAVRTEADRDPIRVMLQSLQFRFGGDILPGQLTSEAFNDLTVQTRTEWLWTSSIQIDLGALFWASFRRDN